MPMRNDETVTFRRSEYSAPDFGIDHVALELDLDADLTTVSSTLDVRRRPGSVGAVLWLDGEELEFVSLALDGRPATRADFEVLDNGIAVRAPTDSFRVHIVNRIRPVTNSQLMGLYVSNSGLYTQCEAEGFRRITYFPDRPDVMARYRVTLRADRGRFPVLLANGNLIEEHDLPDGRHCAVWDDPFAKPSYLFALVAGDFVALEHAIRRSSGYDALLQVWVARADLPRAPHAMRSLQRAIAWDVERYGLELDLDRFMIVASADFNSAAMENKGLNIFNTRYVLASPDVATDTDYALIEAIVGHEYFHNWTGNRVTCRDWFQLSLKEGLTVFREQEFVADMMGDASSRAVKRIADVRRLRATQFLEDAGSMAHPVRPDSYQEIGNFYTATVYEKGAEVVRMLQTLVGVDGFRRGMDLYFERHDGQAVTCEDFVAAMADANVRDLKQFARWYAQAGTPHVAASGAYDAVRRCYELTLTQSTPATPGQPVKAPFHIPLAVGLLGADGRDLPLTLEGEAPPGAGTRVLELTQASHTFRFVDVAERPVPSLLRGFSAPVIVDHDYGDADLAFLTAHDTDAFNRWEAAQRLALARLQRLTDAAEAGRPLALDDLIVQTWRALLTDTALSPAFRALVLALPAEGAIGAQRAMIDPQAIRAARRFMLRELGRRLANDWRTAYDANATPGPYVPDAQPAGRRALRNLALAYLVDGETAGALELAEQQLADAGNMTEREGALASIVNSASPRKADVLVHLGRAWQHEPLLMIKWYQVQATAVAAPDEPPVLERVRALLRHPGFALSNPNNVYALLRSFFALNEAEFHRRCNGAQPFPGYAFWVQQLLALDALNPTVAAHIARAPDRWRRYTPDRQAAMRSALECVAAHRGLSRDVREIIDKSLHNG